MHEEENTHDKCMILETTHDKSMAMIENTQDKCMVVKDRDSRQVLHITRML